MRGNQGGSGGRVGGRGGIRELGILGAQIKRGRLHEMNHNILGDSRLLKLHTFTIHVHFGFDKIYGVHNWGGAVHFNCLGFSCH